MEIKSKMVERLLNDQQKKLVYDIINYAAKSLDITHRFRYFTLHGTEHLKNLYKITDILCDFGLKLNQEQAFLLACAISIHDLGMVIPLKDYAYKQIFFDKPQPYDPADLELLIRRDHHKLIDEFIEKHYDFLISIGLNPSQCALLRDISKCHRKISLNETDGYVKVIGALLRIIDELDISPNRAPTTFLMDHFEEMDATSCWHWFKHNMCEDWMPNHNVIMLDKKTPKIVFKIVVHSPKLSSTPYWIKQISRPINRVLHDEGADKVIIEEFGMQIGIEPSFNLSTPLSLGADWLQIEEKSLSAGRKVILVIDDEARKLEDLFLPLMMQEYHIIFSPNAKDALDKIDALPRIDFIIVDLQIGSGFLWSDTETLDCKMTGKKLCKEIIQKKPSIKIGILTGTRYDISDVKNLEGVKFVLRKPIDSEQLLQELNNVLS